MLSLVIIVTRRRQKAVQKVPLSRVHDGAGASEGARLQDVENGWFTLLEKLDGFWPVRRLHGVPPRQVRAVRVENPHLTKGLFYSVVVIVGSSQVVSARPQSHLRLRVALAR